MLWLGPRSGLGPVLVLVAFFSFYVGCAPASMHVAWLFGGFLRVHAICLAEDALSQFTGFLLRAAATPSEGGMGIQADLAGDFMGRKWSFRLTHEPAT